MRLLVPWGCGIVKKIAALDEAFLRNDRVITGFSLYGRKGIVNP